MKWIITIYQPKVPRRHKAELLSLPMFLVYVPFPSLFLLASIYIDYIHIYIYTVNTTAKFYTCFYPSIEMIAQIFIEIYTDENTIIALNLIKFIFACIQTINTV